MILGKKMTLLVLVILNCCMVKDIEIKSVDDTLSRQMTLDIEKVDCDTVYKDSIYGEWEIMEYIGSAMAAPGISSVISGEHDNEVGKIFSVGEDYFKYGQIEENIIFFCNILPMSYAPEQIYFLPNGMSMKELGVEGEYFIYLSAKGQEEQIHFILKDNNHLILWYKQELYLCERANDIERTESGAFMENAIADCMTTYCSLYEHEWKITGEIPYQKQEEGEKKRGESRAGEIIEFSHGYNGTIWMKENGGERVRLNARISFINGEDGNKEVCGYGTVDELGLRGNFITYISFDTAGANVQWLRGMFIINEDKVLIHGNHVLYECERISREIEAENIKLF